MTDQGAQETDGVSAGDAAELGHSGIVALVGRANVGKSTLVNRILGEKVSIVSPVAQTTRNLLRGVLTDSRGQMVLLDTPGVHRAQNDLGRIMNRAARMSIEGADVALLVLDGSEAPGDEDIGWMKRLAKGSLPWVVAVNKCDRRGAEKTLYREAFDDIPAQGSAPVPKWRELSALTGLGVDSLVDELFGFLPAGPPLFPEDVLSDFPRRWNIGDVIREKLFADLYQELPHAIAVLVDDIAEKDDGSWAVRARILVNRPTQKGIVIGHKGRILRRVRRLAESELTRMYACDVRLDLHVTVVKDWARNHFILRQLGYV